MSNDRTLSEVETLKKLFRGRDDVHGLIVNDSPVCVREPITDTLLLQHIDGKKRIGVYPIISPDTIYFFCVDFDFKPPAREDKEKVDRGIAALIDHGFYPYLERSRSKGFHVWVFFDDGIRAGIVRTILQGILEEAGAVDVEIFPKQDAVTSNNGVGNFIFLPLFGKSVKEGRTVFLKGNYDPYPDQWEVLKKVHFTKTENILELSKQYPEKLPEPRMMPAQGENNSLGSLDVERYLTQYGVKYRVKQDTGRTFYLLDRCLFADEHTTKDAPGDSSIIQGSDGKLGYQCFHSHCAFKTWSDARKALSGDAPIGQFCQGYKPDQTAQRQGRNLTEDLRSWVDGAFSKFTTEQVYRDLGVSTPKDKTHVRVELHRMVEKALIERGTVNGSFLKLEVRADEIQIKDVVPVPLPVILPGGLHERAAVHRKNLLVGAGSSNGGKTAHALNTAYENRNKFDVWCFTTEMDSDELTLRTHNFGYPMNEWRKINFRTWESCHSIKPDAFNILDYLEVKEGEFWRVGDDLRKIFEKLHGGIALVYIQMDRGRQFGWGGQKTIDKCRLYFTLDDNKLTIVKGKNWAPGADNPNGKVRPFELHNGSIFKWGSWS